MTTPDALQRVVPDLYENPGLVYPRSAMPVDPDARDALRLTVGFLARSGEQAKVAQAFREFPKAANLVNVIGDFQTIEHCEDIAARTGLPGNHQVRTHRPPTPPTRSMAPAAGG